MSSSAAAKTLSGLPAARGFAAGPAFLYRGDGGVPVPEYVVPPGAEAAEYGRYEAAVASVRRALEALVAELRERTGREDVRIFECHLMILEDATLRDGIARRIRRDRLNAEAAVRKTCDGAREQFGRMNDPYLRERVRDLDDVERRVLKALAGDVANPAAGLKEPSIVVADDLTPSETMQLPRDLVLGFAMGGGSATSHVALLARALAIPAVCGLGGAVKLVSPGDALLLDGSGGTVTVNPGAGDAAQFASLAARQATLAGMAASGPPAGTMKDGSRIAICANVHPGVPVAGAKDYGADGIGLYRSEYLWLDRDREPTEEEQAAAYREAAEFAASLRPGAAATIRLLDIGGDKLVRGISARERNPFLGNRSIRYLLSDRRVMRTQLRAILRASAAGKIRILVPMVSCIEELRETAAELEHAKRSLAEEGVAFDAGIEIGAMIEVPSAALNAHAFAKHVAFFSVGTNDLVQYTMAADRGNETVAHLCQPLNPAVVELVARTLSAARAAGISAGVCGESATDPVAAVLWAALGASDLSVSATYIPVLSAVFSRLSRADLEEYAKVPASLPEGSTGGETYAACRKWLLSRLGAGGGGLLE